jgi:hypothetical protein
MAVTIFGRGIPMSAVGVSDTQINVAVGGTAILDIHSTGVSALAISAATLTPATLNGTTVTGSVVYGTAVSGTSVSATTITAGTFLGNAATSGGSTKLAFVAPSGGKMVSGYSGINANMVVCADALLCATYNAVQYYIPCFSAYAKEA